ncbi:MAG: hypothetical protein V1709_06695 [Planctomycetota bacterium]
MLNEFGKCWFCGEKVGPPYDREDDSLCKQCFDDLCRWYEYGEILRAGLPEDMSVYNRDWQVEIDKRIDDENAGYADIASRLPKKPLVGAGGVTPK